MMQSGVAEAAALVKQYVEQLGRLGVREFYVPQDALVVKKRDKAHELATLAGQLLTKMIKAMGLNRDQVYICNVIKCRPPENRDPHPEEIACCERFLLQQLEIIQPKVIVALGRFAVQTLLRDTTPITRLRGKWCDYYGIPLMPTFHPSYLLRKPASKWDAWEDLKEVMRELGLSVPEKRGKPRGS
jgi:uracil-DNA glycosylase family 4